MSKLLLFILAGVPALIVALVLSTVAQILLQAPSIVGTGFCAIFGIGFFEIFRRYLERRMDL